MGFTELGKLDWQPTYLGETDYKIVKREEMRKRLRDDEGEKVAK